MVGTVKQRNFDVNHRVTRDNTILQLLESTFFYSRNVFLRYHTANDFGVELERHFRIVAFVFGSQRFDAQPYVTELTTATRLTYELTFLLDRLADGFTVGNLRLTNVGFNLELATHTVNDDVEVELTHTGDDSLTRFFISLHAERRIFLSQLTKSDTHFFLVCFGFRLNRYSNNGIREFHAFQNNFGIDITQGITCSDVFQTNTRCDVASVNFFDLFARVGVHLNDTTNALALGLDRVEYAVTRIQYARVDANKGQRTHERVSCDLERQRSERRVVVGFTSFDGTSGIIQLTFDRFNFSRGRQVFDDTIQNRLNTFVLECRTTGDENDFVVQRTATQSCFDFFLGEVTLFQIFFHQLIRCFSSSFEHELALFFCFGLKFCRNINQLVRHTLVFFIPEDGFHFDQVDNAFEVVFCAPVNLDRHSVGIQTFAQLIDNHKEVGTSTVHLVDEDHTRNFVLVSLTPYRFGLRLNTGRTTQYDNSTVEYAQGTFHFDREVNVSWRIDDVDAVRFKLLVHARPETGSRSGRDSDTTFLLLLHPVHGRSALMHLTDLMRKTGIEEDALSSRRLTRIDVRYDTDITVTIERCLTCHDKVSCGWKRRSMRFRHLPSRLYSIGRHLKSNLETVVRERLVGICHAVYVFTLLNCGTLAFCGIEDFASKTLFHGFFTTGTRCIYHPAHSQSFATGRTHFDRHLIGSTTDAA
ncbi:O-methyltransferase [Zymobacter palmae]|uniref:O-methyltransferase n=1 Tax=Zymobacter palmae TaxID=33074 RepID=A0A348HBU2_9GAMM|nr:O-methyltransferase [Zymobacter palmae]